MSLSCGTRSHVECEYRSRIGSSTFPDPPDDGLPLPSGGVSKPFVPDDFDPPRELSTPGFRLLPLDEEHNESDHAAGWHVAGLPLVE